MTNQTNAIDLNDNDLDDLNGGVCYLKYKLHRCWNNTDQANDEPSAQLELNSNMIN